MPDNPDHSIDQHPDDDGQFHELFSSIDNGVPPMPPGLLDRVKSFGVSETDTTQPGRPSGVVPPDTPAKTSSSLQRTVLPPALRSSTAPQPDSGLPGDRGMLVTRLILTVSALALSTVAAFVLQSESTEASLGSVLEQTLDSDTLQLEIVRDGDTAEVWMTRDGKIRWQEAESRYVIASGSRLWRIDEESNSAIPDANPWRSKEQPVDLLAMLDFDKVQSASLKNAQPVGQKMIDGTMCDVFRVTLKDNGQPLIVEAYADSRSHQLRSLACWHGERPPGDAPPFTEMRLVARNVPVDESKFVVSNTLTQDGRLGKTYQTQGIVTLKPLNHRRWTPIFGNVLVKTGDWLKTDRRGANATAVVLESGHQITIGPGSLIEFRAMDELHLHSGEVQIIAPQPDSDPLKLTTLESQPLEIDTETSGLYRLRQDGSVKRIDSKPVWLQGFEGTSNNESLGSLIANVRDGESVALSLSRHKVTVDIRDQIARTTIVESFHNHTASTLEGVFHFPLPQDASISGFGMWINGELIEADVVEKQRAREIYESILREKKDPALLEWTGGNIFKARVFPIEAHSEKQIRIVYTQVLPLRANQYRYAYGLRSEMLQSNPLRELSINVNVNSVLPIKSIHSPTHDVRSQMTEHSGRIEFEEQDYTPTRDFEVVCDIDARQSDVVVIPHRRGEDGYFMLQLTPPTADGDWQRELLPDGAPLDILLVCDTSASMHSDNRTTQTAFVSSILASLGNDDRFNIAVADVDCRWLFPESVNATDANRTDVLKKLEKRMSLGWTDLDRAFASIRDKASDSSHVVYIGDGITTSQSSDPQAFVKRLDAMYTDGSNATFHAVSVGSSFESVVLRAIARLGSGSVRHIDGEMTPQRVALELLNELTQPGLRDITVEFRGVQVAATYPSQLPNLAAGTQQVLLGRYLPTGKDQSGEIVVQGKRDGETVRYAANFDLRDAESGNSFIPRLWARSHLDQLLDQGSDQIIRDQIVSLSEEFHIITPFTSLLVLESDAQREQYGVKRRYQMRDGERFFADGRSNVEFELLQQQMKRASDWRIQLRQRILVELRELGRTPALFQSSQRYPHQPYTVTAGFEVDKEDEIIRSNLLGDISAPFGAVNGPVSGSIGGAFITGGFGGGGGGAWSGYSYYSGRRAGERYLNTLSKSSSGPAASPFMSRFDVEQNSPFSRLSADGSTLLDDRELLQKSAARQQYFEADAQQQIGYLSDSLVGIKGKLMAADSSTGVFDGIMSAGKPSRFGRGYGDQANTINWISELFPRLPVPVRPRRPVPGNPDWPQEAVALSNSLLRESRLQSIAGGLAVRQSQETIDPDWKRVTQRTSDLMLFSPTRWLTRTNTRGEDNQLNWCDEKQRGVISLPFQLGQQRQSFPSELKNVPVGELAYASTSLAQTFRGYDVSLTAEEDGAVRLELQIPHATDDGKRIIVINTEMNCVVEERGLSRGKVTWKRVYSDFSEVAGLHWPGRIESFDSQGRVTSRQIQTVEALEQGEFDQLFAENLSEQNSSFVLQHPTPSVSAAEKAVAAGSPNAEAHFVLMLQACLVQKWDKASEHLTAVQNIASGKPGLAWVEGLFEISRGRHEAARQLFIEVSTRVADEPREDLFLANFLIARVRSIANANEGLEFTENLAGVYDRQPEYTGRRLEWNEHRRMLYEVLGDSDSLATLMRSLAEAAPWDTAKQTRYAQFLARTGDPAAGFAWLDRQLRPDSQMTTAQRNMIRHAYLALLDERGMSAEAVTFTQNWIAEDDIRQDAYARYLKALIFDDQTAKADQIAAEWLASCMAAESLNEMEYERLEAAVAYSIGQRVDLYVYSMDGQWFDTNRDTVLHFMKDPRYIALLRRIMGRHPFSDSDQADTARNEAFRLLKDGAAAADIDLLSAYLEWTNYRIKKPAAEWSEIANKLLARREQTTKETEYLAITQLIKQIYKAQFRETKYLPFMRQLIADMKAREQNEQAATFARELFESRLSESWSAEQEEELFGLIDQLSADLIASVRQANAIAALHKVVDEMLKKRQIATRSGFQDSEHPETLTRPQLYEKYREFEKAAMSALVDRLKILEASRSDELTSWLTLERLYFEVKLERDMASISQTCWKLLGTEPPAPYDFRTDVLPDDAEINRRMSYIIGSLRTSRLVTTLMYIAAQKSSSDESRSRVAAFIDEGIAKSEGGFGWKHVRYQLLVALDLPEELEKALKRWITQGDDASVWKRTLAILSAERGQLKKAIGLLEQLEHSSLLAPDDYSHLADWYLAENDRKRYTATRLKILESIPEWQLQNWISQQMQPWYRTGSNVTDEVDENVILAFKALFAKTGNAEQYYGDLSRHYAASRDFRLLAVLPDSVLGQTPLTVYRRLHNIHASVLTEMRKEATADEILKRIKLLRQDAHSAVDRRALDLLEALVERKNSELLNQAGPHAEAAKAALTRAFNLELQDGELTLLAKFLDDLGRLKQPVLIDEQIRQLRELQSRTEVGTDEHLQVTSALTNALFWYYDKRSEAMLLTEQSITAYEQSHPEGWPVRANLPLSRYIKFLETHGQLEKGEDYLKEHIAAPANTDQKDWMVTRLNELYIYALSTHAKVSLGKDDELLTSLVERLETQAEQGTDRHRYDVLIQLTELFRTAHHAGIATRKEQLKKYVFETMPSILRKLKYNYSNVVTKTAHTVEYVIGKRVGLQFLITVMENYPDRLEFGYDNAWQRHSYLIGQWREKVGSLGSWDDRLLAIVIRELKRDMRARSSRNRYIYYRSGSRYFWEAKAADFAKAAEEIYEERTESARAVNYISDYLYSGLNLFDRAIEMQLVAHRKGQLDENRQARLCGWLQDQNRFGKSIALAEPLVDKYPDNAAFRVYLINAYTRTKRINQRDELVAESDQHFRAGGRWIEDNIRQFAACFVQNKLYEKAVQYYSELIPLHQRSIAPFNQRRNTFYNLGEYYRLLSEAHAALGNTRDAMDAASGALAVWQDEQYQRDRAISAMKAALSRSSDLNAYVAFLDEEAEKNGTDSPLIRRLCGEVFAGRGNHRKAAAQFQTALLLDPYDASARKGLIAALDSSKQPEIALIEMLKQIEIEPHNLELYKQLVRRTATDEELAERTLTMIIEAAPTEAAHHQTTAEILQERQRWSEAADQWEQVAALQSFEPVGLIGLGKAQVQTKDAEGLRKTIDRLKNQSWPSRFTNVNSEIQNFEAQLKKLAP